MPALEGVSSHEGIGSRTVCCVGRRHAGVSARAEHRAADLRSTGWITRGRRTPLRAKLADRLNFLFAPDGRRLALQIFDGQSDIWVYEWARDASHASDVRPGP